MAFWKTYFVRNTPRPSSCTLENAPDPHLFCFTIRACWNTREVRMQLSPSPPPPSLLQCVENEWVNFVAIRSLFPADRCPMFSSLSLGLLFGLFSVLFCKWLKVRWNSRRCKQDWMGGGGRGSFNEFWRGLGDSHMERSRMLVVRLRCQNLGFWYRL